MPLDRPAQDRLVTRERRRHRFRVLLPVLRAARDVGEGEAGRGRDACSRGGARRRGGAGIGGQSVTFGQELDLPDLSAVGRRRTRRAGNLAGGGWRFCKRQSRGDKPLEGQNGRLAEIGAAYLPRPLAICLPVPPRPPAMLLARGEGALRADKREAADTLQPGIPGRAPDRNTLRARLARGERGAFDARGRARHRRPLPRIGRSPRSCLKSGGAGAVRPPRIPNLAGLGHIRGRDRPEKGLLERLRPSKPPFSNKPLGNPTILYCRFGNASSTGRKAQRVDSVTGYDRMW